VPARMHTLRLYRGLRLLRTVDAPLDPNNNELVQTIFLDQVKIWCGTLHRVDLSRYKLHVVGLNGGPRHVVVTMKYSGEWVIKR
jgi:hypothetical protein